MEKDGGFKMGFQDRSKMASRHLLPQHTAAENKSLERSNGKFNGKKMRLKWEEKNDRKEGFW